MVLSDPAESGLESAGCMDGWIRFSEQDKTLPLQKIRDCYFFLAVYHSKNHVIPRRVIGAILDVILNILQRRKTTMTC